jgi:hypothetical protein
MNVDSLDSGVCAPRVLSPLSRRAVPCGDLSIVFQEKKASSDVFAPSGP